MTDVLVYQTSDPDFADRAIAALRDAGVGCHRQGQGVRKLNATIGNWTDDQIFIYVHHAQDVQRANEILIDIGAAVDRPIRFPHRWLLLALAAGLTILIGLVIASA